MVQTPNEATAASQITGVQQDVDHDIEVAAKSQPVALAPAQHEVDLQGEEDEDWQSFKEAFEQDDFIAPEASEAVDFLSSAVVKQIRHELLTDLMLTFHDAQLESASVPAEHRPAQIPEQSAQTDSTLSFDKLDSVEQSIDNILKKCDDDEVFRETLSAAGSSTPPPYESYASSMAGDDLMQKLVECHMQKVRKPELFATSVVEGAGRLDSEDSPGNSFTASSSGELLL